MELSPLPPETLEGWYALHQVISLGSVPLPVDDGPRDTFPTDTAGYGGETAPLLEELASTPGDGWSAGAALIGSTADLLLMHFRPTLEELGVAERRVKSWAEAHGHAIESSFLSVTEAGLYHLTAQLAQNATARGGTPGDDEYRRELAERSAKERESAFARKRLYPERPPDMPYVCFYPMSKRRQPGQNWYSLSLDERSRLMHAHGTTGRRYAGRVMQVITGAIGFEGWEWGVTLFARDPLDFKKLVTDMRFDEVSAKYAEFGEFYVGRLLGLRP